MRRLFALLLAAGCGDNLVGSPPPGFDPRVPPTAPEVIGYPEEPPEGYGGSEGQVLPDMRFSGFFVETPSPVEGLPYRDDIRLSDIRALEGYTHLLLNVAAEWCKPCREEADILPAFFESWAPRGGFLLGVINQDRLYNSADRRAVEGWARRYASNYPLAHDPEGWVASLLDPSTVPINLVVDLRTMRVLRARVGEDPDTFRFFDSLLAPP